jgi:hypothetical protein
MKRNREAGQALAAVALAMVALIGIIGLAIDMGYMRYEKRRLQSAADSAAIAGASERQYYAAGDSRITTAAQNDSMSNGFQDSVNGITVLVSNPPTDAPFSGVLNPNDYVEVNVQQTAPTYFMRIFGVNSFSLSARAVAHLGNGRNCIYALGLNDPNALIITGSIQVVASGCGIVSNGDFTVNGGAQFRALAIGYVGASNIGGGSVAPAPVKSIPAADPLASLPQPPVGSCVPFVQPPVPGSTYCGISISAGTVVFPSGVYVIAGDFVISGTATVTGIGVTFFVTKGIGPGAVSPCGPGPFPPGGQGAVTFCPGALTDFQAPRSGSARPYEGVLMMRDRSDLPNPPASSLMGGNGQELEGAIYFPTASITLGNTTNSDFALVVAKNITIQGINPRDIFDVSTISPDPFSLLSDGSPIRGAVLVQ